MLVGETGIVIDGIGFVGIVLTFFALVAAAGLFSVYPRISIPQAGDLNKGTPRQMIAPLLLASLAGAAVESLPFTDVDNLLVPAAVGAVLVACKCC